MRRVVRPELLDSDQALEHEVRTSLVDLKLINRWFGGISTTKHLIGRGLSGVQRKQIRILDVGSATGDGPLKATSTFPGKTFSITLLDRDPSHFDGTRSRARCVAGDALSLPFTANSFDFVICSLFAHHLEPSEIQQFANEALRVCRIALLINDLRRSYLHLGLVYAGLPLFRSPITRHDTVASVQRAYTTSEMADILKSTSASKIEIHNTYLYRMGVIAWK
jgi:ubiquinone/menaquinone biosynthesis C-methylase UbiE